MKRSTKYVIYLPCRLTVEDHFDSCLEIMMYYFVRFSAFLFAVLVITGCDQRLQSLYDPAGIPIPDNLSTAPLETISDAVTAGGKLAGWKMSTVSPGKVHGTLNVRTHQADVDIDFTTTEYSIVYVSSRNLLSQGARIHKAYNQWIRELEVRINTELDEAAAKYQPAASAKSAANDDTTAWLAVKDSKNPKELLAFMEKYGSGQYAPAAIAQLNSLLDKNGKSASTAFNPIGAWNVAVSYTSKATQGTYCLKASDWKFVLDIREGKISRTVYEGGRPLYVTGEVDKGNVSLDFAVIGGGKQWEWTEKFKLDKRNKSFTKLSGATSSSGCQGVLDITMRKISR